MELFATDLDRLAFLLEADASFYLDDLIAQGVELVAEELPGARCSAEIGGMRWFQCVLLCCNEMIQSRLKYRLGGKTGDPYRHVGFQLR